MTLSLLSTRIKLSRAIAALLIALIVFGIFVNRHGTFIPDFGDQQLEQLKGLILSLGLWGPLAYMGLLILSVVISQIPGAPLAVLAGSIWSPFWAAIFTIMGGFTGAAIAYGLGRTFGIPLTEKILGKPFQLDLGPTEKQLGGMIFLSRLVPVIPFDLLSYGAGISRVSWPLYASATFLGMIPSTFLLVYGTQIDFSALTTLVHHGA